MTYRLWMRGRLLPAMAVVMAIAANAQTMQVDRAYTPLVANRKEALEWLDVAPLRSGRFLLSGPIAFVGQVRVGGIVRVDSDGAYDPQFGFVDLFGSAESPPIELPDGRLLRMRAQATLDPVISTFRLFRLREDGATDPDFVEYTGRGYWVQSKAMRDGRSILWGLIDGIAGFPRNGLARLQADGTLDVGYAPLFPATRVMVSHAAVRDDGVVVARYAPVLRFRGGSRPELGPAAIARILADGTLDPAFVPGTVPAEVYAVDSGGRVFVSGAPLARLLPDGSIDPAFAPALGDFREITAVKILSDGRMLVSGRITTSTAAVATVVLATSEGASIADLRTVVGWDRAVELLAVDNAGHALIRHVAADREAPENPGSVGFTRLDLATLQRHAFAPDVSARGTIESLATTMGDRIMVSGTFDLIDGEFRPGLARLQADGVVDPSFVAGAPSSDPGLAAVLPDGRVYCRVWSVSAGGTVQRIARLRADGSVDPTLPVDSALATTDATIARVEPDGTVLAYRSLRGDGFGLHSEFLRFDAAGALIERWPLEASMGDTIWAGQHEPRMVRDAAGRLLVSGSTRTGGLYADWTPCILRFLPGGALDMSYASQTGTGASVTAVHLFDNGSALVQAFVGLSAAQPAHRELIRLRPDGTRDPAFRVTENDLPDSSWPLSLQADGSFFALLADSDLFSRWMPDGVRDLNLETELEWPGTPIVQHPDGRIYVGCAFDDPPRSPGPGLARLVPGVASGITVQPLTQSTMPGETLRLQVAISDGAGAQYQWQRDGVDLSGATSARLILDDVSRANSGVYRVVVSVGGRIYVSAPATLSVQPRQAHLVNFSARSYVTAGGTPQIGGFVLGGDGSGHPVLLRAIGGGLSSFILSREVLGRPELALFLGSHQIGWDAGSAKTPAIETIANQVGAFAPGIWEPVPGVWVNYDSALALSLAEGAYTAQTASSALSGQTGGVSLFEFYDAAAQPDPGLVRNVSIRGHAASGARTMIGGFVVGGAGRIRLLLRAVGPELAGFGVVDALDDPKVTLFNEGLPVGVNDDWGGSERDAIVQAALLVGAFPLEPEGKSSAMVATLASGAYTVHVDRGVSASPSAPEGEVLLELYVVEE